MLFVPYWMDSSELYIISLVSDQSYGRDQLQSVLARLPRIAVVAVATLGPLRKNLHDSH